MRMLREGGGCGAGEATPGARATTASGRRALVGRRAQEAVQLRPDRLLHHRPQHLAEQLGGRRLFSRRQRSNLVLEGHRLTPLGGAGRSPRGVRFFSPREARRWPFFGASFQPTPRQLPETLHTPRPRAGSRWTEYNGLMSADNGVTATDKRLLSVDNGVMSTDNGLMAWTTG